MTIELKIKKLRADARIPYYASAGAAAFDLTAVSWRYDVAGDFHEYGTGLAVEIPEGYVGLVYPRSSISKLNAMMANSVGVIDSDYRGELFCRFNEVGGDDHVGTLPLVGDRVAQMMIVELPKVILTQVDELSETERGAGGWGSTGT